MKPLDFIDIEQKHDTNYENMVFHIESVIMAGSKVSGDELAQIPAAIAQKSPLLLKLQGELLMRRGALVEAKEVLLSAVQGFARQTFQSQMLDALAQLAMVNLSLAEWQDAKTILRFLKEEWLRKESPTSGRVLQALAWGSYLLNEAGHEETYFREAWEQFKQEGDSQGVVDLCLDLLLSWRSEMSEQERRKIYYYAEQKMNLDPLYLPVHNMALGLLSADQLRWGDATAILDGVDTSQMSYYHAVLCLIQRFEVRMKANWKDERALWDELNRAQLTFGCDLNLQFQLGMLHYTQAESRGQAELAEAVLYKLMAWQELTRSPNQAEWLKQIHMKREAHNVANEQRDGWEIRCFGNMTFTRVGVEFKGLKWKRKKSLELFLYLLIQPDYSAPKEHIMEMLLGQGYADKMNNQLYVILHQLKQTLKQELQIDPAIIIKDGIIRLHKGQIKSLDLEQYQSYIHEGDQHWSEKPALAVSYYEQAYVMYGEFMSEIRYLDWVDAYRETLQHTQVVIIRKLASYYKGIGQHEQAEVYFNRWLELNPTDEEGFQEYVVHLIATGRKQEAKRVQRKWDKLVSEEQGATDFTELEERFL
ncbi:hypothetical protein GC093_18270 [Paenibacillus sp. LMG 31456]|uniref:Bacterial transcriptional activator domain-containing protein n=1 Tax=Paenibacillus foliorum TaxID=2654974 RepID=A0A972K1S5_9BACL|nr:BTAD domain-containing putative transcriptional regulator [Paenibacillus foliorum]NOU95155.1 hypothetical protein [Paenibacillus foliorum]